jgi:hypothetical protein
LRSVRSVSAKQAAYQTSSADGSCELAGAPPRCEMASRAGLSRHRTDCPHIALRFAQSRCVPGSSAAHPSKPHPLDLASRRPSPYRSRASPRCKLPSILELHTIIRYRAQSQADHNSFTAIARCVCHEQSETLRKLAPKSKDLQSMSLPGDLAAIRILRTKL